MKIGKKTRVWYCLISMLFYLAALLSFLSRKDITLGTLYLCLGSEWLCIAAVAKKKAKDSDGEEKS